MNTVSAERVNGFVMLVGNCAVGKTTTTQVLDLINNGELPDTGVLKKIRKNEEITNVFRMVSNFIWRLSYTLTKIVISPQ